MLRAGNGIYKGAMVYLDPDGTLQVDDAAYKEIAKALRFRQMFEEHTARCLEQAQSAVRIPKELIRDDRRDRDSREESH